MSKDKVISAEDLFHVVFDRNSGLGLAGCSAVEYLIRARAEKKGHLTARDVYEGATDGERLWLWKRTVGHLPRNYYDKQEKLYAVVRKLLDKKGENFRAVSESEEYNTLHANQLLPWGKVVKAFFTELHDIINGF